MPWFKVDDNLAFHHKVLAAGNAAMGLWVRAGAACANQLTDGFVADHMVPALGTVAQAKALVNAGLWTREKGGYRFHGWEERQPCKADVEAQREAAKERMRKRRSPDVRANEHGTSEGVRAPRPVPTRPDPNVVKKSGQSPSVADRLGTDGLDRIKQQTKGNDAHVLKCAEFILSRAPADVRNPLNYVLAAIRDEPDAYRFRRGNPKKHEECPTHAGQWADACAGCAADRKAAH